MTLKITLWKQIKSLAPLLFITLLYIVFLIYAEISLEKKSILIFLLPYLVFFYSRSCYSFKLLHKRHWNYI